MKIESLNWEDLKIPNLLTEEERQEIFKDFQDFGGSESERLVKTLQFYMPFFIKKYNIASNQCPRADKNS